MKNSKKGISLIVLVITIIVIIILAAAVLLTLSKNNPIDKATEARNSSDISEIQSAVTLIMSSMMADIQNSVTVVPGTGNAIVGATFQVTGSSKNYVAEKGTDGKWTTGTSAHSLTADELGIDSKTLEKYVIDANGKVTEKKAE